MDIAAAGCSGRVRDDAAGVIEQSALVSHSLAATHQLPVFG